MAARSLACFCHWRSCFCFFKAAISNFSFCFNVSGGFLGTVARVVGGVIAAAVVAAVVAAGVSNVRGVTVLSFVWAVTTMGGGAVVVDTACFVFVAGRRTADVGVMDAGRP
jgi:hypothetical protein